MPAHQKEAIPADEIEGIITKAVEQKVAEIVAKAGVGAEDAPAWVQHLALSIAQLNDQGSRQKRVPPEVIVQREAAQKRMIERLAVAKAARQSAHYRLVQKVYLNETLIDPKWIDSAHRQRDTEIEWDGVPSSAMRPANDVAEGIYAEFSAWVGGVKMPERAVRVTAGGLTVVSGQKVRGTYDDKRHGERWSEPEHTGMGIDRSGSGLRVLHQEAETPVATRVLGSLHPPAMELP